MLTFPLTALLALAPAILAGELDPAPALARGDLAAGRSSDPCDAEGWIGDGEDGRAAPVCDGPDGDESDPAGLRAPEQVLRGDDEGDDDAWP